MADFINWTPSGCGAAAVGPASGRPAADFAFPCDIISRVEALDLGIEPVFLAWEITRLGGKELSSEQRRALIFLILAARAMAAEGSTRLPLEPGDHLERILVELKATANERAAVDQLIPEIGQLAGSSSGAGLAAVFGGPEDYRPLIIAHNCLYIQKLYVLETRVGMMLKERVTKSAYSGTEAREEQFDAAVEDALQEVFDHPPQGPFGKTEMDDDQKNAVRASLSGRITIVSGRPGSGKTSIVAGILRVLARLGKPPLESIALAAPTGKAADRMRQSIAGHLKAIPSAGEADRRLAEACPPSSTLHRLLGYSPGQDRFWHNENNPLSEQLVIVDESSMIDLAMMDRLLRALQPESRLILLGDADQLLPIEAGAVLRDLCQAKTAVERGRVIILKRSYRAREDDLSGKKIIDAAEAVNTGTVLEAAGEGKAPDIRKRVSELLFEGVEHLVPGDEAQAASFYEEWHARFRSFKPDLLECLAREYISDPSGFNEQTAEALSGILSYYEKFRILCVTRVAAGGSGAEVVNSWFHRRWLEDIHRENIGPANPRFTVGEPVMVTRNDYNLRLYNGDSGLILKVKAADRARRREAEPMAVFPRGSSFMALPLEALRGRLEPAWASTVHKAQGAEYDHVAIMLPNVPVRPLTRELLYTAVTRAKRSVTIVGPADVLEWGIKRTIERASGLADML